MHAAIACGVFLGASIMFGAETNACSEISGVLFGMPKAEGPDAAALIISPKANVPADSEPVSKRLFGVIPNYRADQYSTVYTPISTAEKFKIARSDSFDWPNYFLLAGYALQAQVAAGGFHHNGGISGFGQYYSKSVADQVVGSYLTEATLPSLLHEDPRFFRLGQGSVFYRAFYATSRIFVVKKDDGGSGFYISEIIGNMGVVAVGSAYYTDSRTASASAERYGMALGNDMISNLLTEFWPDIRRKLPLLHKRG
jgi:hypothetical protein